MAIRGAVNHDGQMFQAFPLGGNIQALDIEIGVWREFVPESEAADLYWIEMPRLTNGDIIHTTSTTFPDLAPGDAVSDEHVRRAVRFEVDSRDQLSVDRSRPDTARTFFAIVDSDDTAAVMKFYRANFS